MTDEVTTVVATRNRRHELLRTLPRHDGPVILVDNGSDDGTVDVVRRQLPHVEVVPLRRNRGASARNIGVARARTPYVAFADDDSWWHPGSLDRAAALLRAYPKIGVLAARIVLDDEGRTDPLCEELAASPLGVERDLPGPSILGFAACGAVVRRQAFLSCGGFDRVVFFPGEEERLSLDLQARGWQLVYVADLVAHHRPSPSRSGHDARALLVERNRILTAWMRRPVGVALQRHGAAVQSGGVRRRAAVAAARRLPFALAHRRRVPADVEARALLLESPTAPTTRLMNGATDPV